MNIILIGAQASGKMTIGQELEKISDSVLFHNHETIDFVTKFIPMSTEARELIDAVRLEFFETFAKTGQDIIFTVVIDFNEPDDIAFLEQVQEIFLAHERQVIFVELETDLAVRLARNRTENRLTYKPVKRDLEWSEGEILETAQYCVFNPATPPASLRNYTKINNTNLTAQEVAEWIVGESEKVSASLTD